MENATWWCGSAESFRSEWSELFDHLRDEEG